MNQNIHKVAQDWVDQDPDIDSKAEGQALIDANDEEALMSHFGRSLSFGTAGLRGALGPGPNRMNSATVIRVTSALAAYTKATIKSDTGYVAIIGFDGRYGSRKFADYAARVLLAEGFTVHVFDDVVPTPRLAHALLEVKASIGIMVTASHNPPQDNGYKVYWADGAQIIPPHDTGISKRVDMISDTSHVPLGDLQTARDQGRLIPISQETQNRYYDAVSQLRVYDGPTDLKIVYSAMHGVGRLSVERVLRENGYKNINIVGAQADPDPDFPTVAFPNPEEPGAMDLSLQLAHDIDADVVFANDPDADRLCVAIPIAGGYRLLTGNEIGILLADELLKYGQYPGETLVVTTIVSTSMLQKVAAEYGARCVETLTGFKWLAHEGMKQQSRGGSFVVGFEEAIGYSVGPIVRDKDGVSAALIFADLASRSMAQGHSLESRLNQLYRTHGLYETTQRSFKFPGQSGQVIMAKMMDKLRSNPPTELDGCNVSEIKDYLISETKILESGEQTNIDLPKSNVLGFHMTNGSRLMVRPSGTEPKIKFYFEICEPVLDGESIDDVRRRAIDHLAQFVSTTMAQLHLD
ncbi:MAG: phospho-sugar mutase [Myxococcota bacterium]|nr:phospho-sugar mutase [Myxococcota bacterium]